MKQVSIATSEQIGVIKNWNRSQEGNFTEDQVIDAFLYGRKTALSQEEKLFKNTFSENFEKINHVLSEFFNAIFEIDKKAKLHLKISDYSKFEASITVSEKYYLDNKNELFETATKIEDKVKSEFLSFYINFLPLFDDVDYDILKADGYRFEYKN